MKSSCHKVWILWSWASTLRSSHLALKSSLKLSWSDRKIFHCFGTKMKINPSKVSLQSWRVSLSTPKSTSCACLVLFGTSCIFKEQSPAFAIYIPFPFHLLPLLPSWCHWAPGQQPDHGKCHCWIGWKLGSTRLNLAHCWELVDSFRSAMWRRRHRGVCGISKYVLGLMRWITAEAEVSIWGRSMRASKQIWRRHQEACVDIRITQRIYQEKWKTREQDREQNSKI